MLPFRGIQKGQKFSNGRNFHEYGILMIFLILHSPVWPPAQICLFGSKLTSIVSLQNVLLKGIATKRKVGEPNPFSLILIAFLALTKILPHPETIALLLASSNTVRSLPWIKVRYRSLKISDYLKYLYLDTYVLSS